MKNFALIPVFLLLIVSCNQEKKKDSSQTVEKAAVPKAVSEPKADTPYSAPRSEKDIIKEQLFFHLRENVADIDRYSVVKSESLKFDWPEFEYTLVYTDKGNLFKLDDDLQGESAKASIINDSEANSRFRDTLVVYGALSISFNTTDQKEGKLYISGGYSLSYLSLSHYSYGEYRTINMRDPIEDSISVSLAKQRAFTRDELYLKARIHELKEEELSHLSKEEKGYLRNEIFARHGHFFKTEKMQNYFAEKLWFTPYFYDATPFLNPIEKKNALFIKSLEQ